MRSNDQALCYTMISRSANLEFLNKEGLKPIQVALKLQLPKMVEILLKHTRLVDCVDCKGDSLLALAAESGN